MKITSAEVFVGGPGKNYVTLKIMTDAGIYGIGDGTLNTRETLTAEYLREYLIPCLIGMDPRNSEDIWQYFYRGAYFRRGPIAMAAYGAIDLALWDIKGKIAGLPLYQLFGGKSRDGALTYAHAVGTDLEMLLDSVAHYVEQGYKAIRLQCGIPLKLLHDVHHRLRPREAAAFGKEIEKYNLFWMEDPTPADDQYALRLIRQQ